MFKYLPLLWANLGRKRLRTSLTIASIVVAFVPLSLRADGAFKHDHCVGNHRLVTDGYRRDHGRVGGRWQAGAWFPSYIRAPFRERFLTLGFARFLETTRGGRRAASTGSAT